VNLHAIDANLLVTLDALLIERSVSRTAARIGRSQPATSNALARLRELFGDPLLVRTRDGMRPTPRAVALAAPLRQAVAGLQHALAAPARFMPATARATISIGLTDYGALVVLPSLARALARRAPGIDLRAHAFGPGTVDALASGQLDIALGRFAQVRPRFRRVPVLSDALCTVVRAGHPLTSGRLTLARLARADHVLVSIGEGTGAVDEVLARHGLVRRIAVRVAHFLVVPHIIEATDLVATVPGRVASSFGRSLRSLRSPVEIPGFELSMAWHEDHDGDPAQRWVRTLVLDLFAQRGADDRRPRRRPAIASLR
jgi:DNA-binding transcriptional LysR family regulator